MPTHDEEDTFWHDWDTLTKAQRQRFYTAIYKLVDDFKAGQGFRKSSRVKGVQGHEGL